MIDATKGYDLTKPLLIEAPYNYLSPNALDFDPKENIVDDFMFFSGDPVEEKDYQLTLECNMRENKLLELDIVPSDLHGLVVNQKIFNILQKVCPKDFQFFPVIIKSKSSKKKSKAFVNRDYYFIHIIAKVDAIDMEASEFILLDEDGPKVRRNMISPQKIRFRSNCMGKIHLAKDKNFTGIHMISIDLFYILYQENITGAEFMPDYLSHCENPNAKATYENQEKQ